MERRKWTPEGRERLTTETLLDHFVERTTRPVACEAARGIYDDLVSGRLTYDEWNWKPIFGLLAHVGAFGAYCDEHSADCAYWQPWPPTEPPEEQSRNYPEHMARMKALKADGGKPG